MQRRAISQSTRIAAYERCWMRASTASAPIYLSRARERVSFGKTGSSAEDPPARRQVERIVGSDKDASRRAIRKLLGASPTREKSPMFREISHDDELSSIAHKMRVLASRVALRLNFRAARDSFRGKSGEKPGRFARNEIATTVSGTCRHSGRTRGRMHGVSSRGMYPAMSRRQVPLVRETGLRILLSLLPVTSTLLFFRVRGPM